MDHNIEARLLENAPSSEIEKVVVEAMEPPKERMILKLSAGPIAPLTSRGLKNYHIMIDIWEELSAL